MRTRFLAALAVFILLAAAAPAASQRKKVRFKFSTSRRRIHYRVLDVQTLPDNARASCHASDGNRTRATDTSSVVKFAETLFGTAPLASLPDERPHLPQGPRDTNSALTDLLGAFDVERLEGERPAIPASAALLPDPVVDRIPTPMNCRSLGITPVAIPDSEKAPAGFRARPSVPDL